MSIVYCRCKNIWVMPRIDPECRFHNTFVVALAYRCRATGRARVQYYRQEGSVGMWNCGLCWSDNPWRGWRSTREAAWWASKCLRKSQQDQQKAHPSKRRHHKRPNEGLSYSELCVHACSVVHKNLTRFCWLLLLLGKQNFGSPPVTGGPVRRAAKSSRPKAGFGREKGWNLVRNDKDWRTNVISPAKDQSQGSGKEKTFFAFQWRRGETKWHSQLVSERQEGKTCCT